MNHPVRPLVLWLALAGALAGGLLTLVGCQNGSRRGRAAGAPAAADASDPGSGEGAAAGEVNLTPADLAPIDAYIKRPQWILGDDVDVVASKEYFVQVLSIATRIGMCKREDFQDKDSAGSVITFLGRPEQVSEQTAPRLLIGTGLTITARHKLTVRFVPTRNVDLPVRLRVAANGKASLGSKANVLKREPSLVIGVQLRRVAGGGYQYEEQ